MAVRSRVGRRILVAAAFLLFVPHQANGDSLLPVVLNTWPFTDAADKGYDVMNKGGSALDGIVQGITICEMKPCFNNPKKPNVGFGGNPNEEGEITLDAIIMDGVTHASAAVGCLKRIKNAIGVARAVMNYTKHSLLVGDDATKFAVRMGFPNEDLRTNNSIEVWNEWKAKNCQPNFWKNLPRDQSQGCGPYNFTTTRRPRRAITESNHDTIGMVAVDSHGNVAAGSSTNGLGFKIPGRVGDSSIAGAAAYADNDVGAAATTGNGDLMIRFLPTYQAVEFMRQGYPPAMAAKLALKRITKHYKDFVGSIIVVNKKGEYGAASYKWKFFKYAVRNPKLRNSTVIADAPFDPSALKETPCVLPVKDESTSLVSSTVVTTALVLVSYIVH